MSSLGEAAGESLRDYCLCKNFIFGFGSSTKVGLRDFILLPTKPNGCHSVFV
jgi:hypothetical protein